MVALNQLLQTFADGLVHIFLQPVQLDEVPHNQTYIIAIPHHNLAFLSTAHYHRQRSQYSSFTPHTPLGCLQHRRVTVGTESYPLLSLQP